VRHEVAVELVRPPPPPPKVEAPKPPPPPKKLPVRVLPQIQAPTPEPPTVAEAVSSEPPVAVAEAVPAPASEPELPVTPPIGRAGYLNNPPPEYPAVAARQQWQGTVVLRVRVLSSGAVDTIEVRESSGRRVLDEQAVKTVKNWRFTPSRRGDTPIDGWATVPIEFRLDS
jgi:protein TonB